MDLLTDDVFTVDQGGTRNVVCLPELLAALSRDEIDSFPRLQAHQEHAWYALLVQLAAMSLEKLELDALPVSGSAWVEALLSLSEGDPEAWRLIQPDPDRPGFLQPPLPDGLASLKNEATTPDAIDLPVTAKNHDVKQARITKAEAEHWVYALVNAQTMQGFGGAKNYGILRMNGGLGNRPYVARVGSLRWGPRFIADALSLHHNAEQAAVAYGYDLEGIRLVWTEPWDGTKAIVDQALHPWCVEICRRIRLVQQDHGIVARVGNSTATRISTAADGGDVGDPWTPVDRASGKALTLSSQGFDYKMLVRLMGGVKGAFDPSLAMRYKPSGAAMLIGRALVRGQGKTEGFHERLLPVPARAVALLAESDGLERAAGYAATRVGQVKEAKNALASAIRRLLAAGGDSGQGEKRHHAVLDQFEAAVDRRFFECLWERVAADDEAAATAADAAWVGELHDLARAHLEIAIQSVPVPQGRLWRAKADAEGTFFGVFRKNFPNHFEKRESHDVQ